MGWALPATALDAQEGLQVLCKVGEPPLLNYHVVAHNYSPFELAPKEELRW